MPFGQQGRRRKTRGYVLPAEDFLRLLDTADASDFAKDPLPGWSGPDTLFGAALIDPGASFDLDWVAAGIPFDATASSRPGAAEGPRAIRNASVVFSSYVSSLGEHEMLDMRTGEAFHYRRPRLGDAGDLHTYPTNPEKNFKAIALEVERLARKSKRLVLLGGEHTISFPAFVGVQRGLRARDPKGSLGFIQIDHHFDFGMESKIFGSLYHGSNARRISELPDVRPERMAFVGVGSVTRKAQFDDLTNAGYRILPATLMRREGVKATIVPLLRALLEHCSALYLSIDIDVLNSAEAPGTGNVSIGGLTTSELFDTLQAFHGVPLVAVDLVEVSPRYDPTGRTAQIAARALFELIYRSKP
jgi:agmatinase